MTAFSNMLFRLAKAEDDDILKRILRQNEMDSWVQLSFEREPGYFLGAELMGKAVTVIAQDKQQPTNTIGMYYCSCLPVHFNGIPEQINYLGGLRVSRQFRNQVSVLKNGLSVLKNGYRSIKSSVKTNATLSVYFTSIAKQNSRARRILEKNLPSMPVYAHVGELQSIVIKTKAKSTQASLVQAAIADIPELVNFYNNHASQYQFSPVLSADWLKKIPQNIGLSISDFWLYKTTSGIQACLALWNQRSFKQIVVRGYRFPLNVLRIPSNLLAKYFKLPVLPPVGACLKQIYVSFLAIDTAVIDKTSIIFANALNIARQQGADTCVTGLSVDNPVLPQLKKNFRSYTYSTLIETVNFNRDDGPVMNSRSVQPEIALL